MRAFLNKHGRSQDGNDALPAATVLLSLVMFWPPWLTDKFTVGLKNAVMKVEKLNW